MVRFLRRHMHRFVNSHSKIQRQHLKAAIARLDLEQSVEGDAYWTARERRAALRINGKIPCRAVGPSLIAITQSGHVSGRTEQPFFKALAVFR